MWHISTPDFFTQVAKKKFHSEKTFFVWISEASSPRGHRSGTKWREIDWGSSAINLSREKTQPSPCSTTQERSLIYLKGGSKVPSLWKRTSHRSSIWWAKTIAYITICQCKSKPTMQGYLYAVEILCMYFHVECHYWWGQIFLDSQSVTSSILPFNSTVTDLYMGQDKRVQNFFSLTPPTSSRSSPLSYLHLLVQDSTSNTGFVTFIFLSHLPLLPSPSSSAPPPSHPLPFLPPLPLRCVLVLSP